MEEQNKKNNNGKLVIAILAMFVVSLSIIGFTYAYFTTQVTGNTATESVKVAAGKLEITYTSNRNIEATGIVPGWKSDGLHYYDPTYRDEKGHIVAQSVDNASSIPENYKNSNYGVIEPATFTIKNSGDDTAYYAVKLTDITNGLNQDIESVTTDGKDDRMNLTATLYRGTFTAGSLDGAQKIGSDLALIPDGSNELVFSTPLKIEKSSEDQNYFIMLEYKNNDTVDQSKSMNAQVKATVNVVGIAKTSTAWVDATGKTVINGTTEAQ